jgi:hypothetical protein
LLTHHRLPPLADLVALDDESITYRRTHQPSVEELLDVDREYRQKAAAGELPLTAPQRFNPTGDRWLPVLHTRRGSRRYTALYSNTERARRLGRLRDWVVLYVRDDAGERQYNRRHLDAWRDARPPRGCRPRARVPRRRAARSVKKWMPSSETPDAGRARARD